MTEIREQLLEMLKAVATALGDDLRNRLVFVGGCALNDWGKVYWDVTVTSLPYWCGTSERKLVFPPPLAPTRIRGLGRPSSVKVSDKSSALIAPLFSINARLRYMTAPSSRYSATKSAPRQGCTRDHAQL
jgi:hypothetical protein